MASRVGRAPSESGAAGAYDLVAPDPAALIESLRAFGYTPQSALADLVDNSLTAEAQNVWIDLEWNGANSTVAITDDGYGMTEAGLVDAMRPGSRNPLEARATHDLGRFGLGLKTASFSQCRRLTVITKRARTRGPSVRTWDLDLVARSREWRLLRHASDSATGAANRLEGLKSGTVVIWEVPDRIVGPIDDRDDDERDHRRFLDVARTMRRHLAVTFHRFMVGRAPTNFYLNGRLIEPWSPFSLAERPGGQLLRPEVLPFKGREIRVTGYVLPHRSRLTEDEFRYGGLPGGWTDEDPRLGGVGGSWNDLQGFYVYRNQRLLVAADYLGLGFLKEDHFRLARIAVDIDNQADEDWQIDVRKSVARPPGPLREDLHRIALVVRTRAAEVYRHRGRELTRRASKGVSSTWSQHLRQGKITYKINRDHPLAQTLLEKLPPDSKRQMRSLLTLIEETVPVPLISINNSERQEEVAAPFEGDSASLSSVAKQILKVLTSQGLTPTAARNRLAALEPFNLYPEIVEAMDDGDTDPDAGLES